MPRLAGLRGQEKPGAELLTGRQTVRVANTAISISTDPAGANIIQIGSREVLVQADPNNGANVVVGDAMITILPPRGAVLAARESVVIAIDDVSKIFVNGAVIGEGVVWMILR